MDSPQAEIVKIRNLINAQVVNITWFSDISNLIGIDVKTLEKKRWFDTYWNSSWGNFTIKQKDSSVEVQWDRNDGGKPMMLVSTDPMNIQMMRIAATAKLCELSKHYGRFTYMEVGMAYCTQVKVYLNGKEVEQCTCADALLNFIERHYRDDKGNLIANDAGDSLRRQRLNGMVEIILQDKPLTFF